MTSKIPLLGAACLALAAAILALACAGPNAWLKPQGELVQLERQAAAALKLSTDARTQGALRLCITSAQAGAHRIDELLQAQEQLRQAKKQGVDLPELQERVKAATAAADKAEDIAIADCARAGVRKAGAPPQPGDGGTGDAGHPDAGAAGPELGHPPDAGVPHDMSPRPAADGGSR